MHSHSHRHRLRWFPLEISHQVQIAPSPAGWAAFQPLFVRRFSLWAALGTHVWVDRARAAQETKSKAHFVPSPPHCNAPHPIPSSSPSPSALNCRRGENQQQQGFSSWTCLPNPWESPWSLLCRKKAAAGRNLAGELGIALTCPNLTLLLPLLLPGRGEPGVPHGRLRLGSPGPASLPLRPARSSPVQRAPWAEVIWSAAGSPPVRVCSRDNGD